MTPISAGIITFDEENNIGRYIDSLEDVVDDIVVYAMKTKRLDLDG